MPGSNQRRTRNKKIKYYTGGGLPQTKDGILQIGARKEKSQEEGTLNLAFRKQLGGTILQFSFILL